MSFTRDELRDAGRLGMVLGGWVATIGLAVYTVAHYVAIGEVGGDAHAYWLAGRSAAPYVSAPGHADAFEYSPVFVQAIRPLSHLPFHVFYGLWAAAELGAFWWMTSGLAWKWRVPVLLLCVPELCLGNINAFFGLVLVAGFRWPELWAFPALTKITPSGVGFAWMLVRRDFRGLLRSLACIAVLSAVSYLFDPRLWHEWFYFLHHNAGGSTVDISVRLALSLGAAAVLARIDLGWPLPAPFIFAAPVFGFSSNQCLAMLPPALALAKQGDVSEPPVTLVP